MGALSTTAFSANPDEECCEPSISGQPWEDNGSSKYSLDPVVGKIVDVLKFIPGGVKPHLSGNITVASFIKTGCCSPQDTTTSTISKGEISGSAGIGVDTGRVPLPGLSLPLGMGGAYISASTSVDVTLTGSGESSCGSPILRDFSAKGDVSQTISLAGGINVWGDSLAVELEGSAKIEGGIELSYESGWKANSITGKAEAHFVILLADHEVKRIKVA